MSDIHVKPFLLLGCGVLEKEIRYLVEKNRWPATIEFLPPSLHNDIDRLESELMALLDRHTDEPILLYFGHCHPIMDDLVDRPNVVRVMRENCVASLIGDDPYFEEQRTGSYFLLEEWARGWKATMAETFGHHPEAIREIFADAHKRMVAITTPISGEYGALAVAAARDAGLPLIWRAVDLTRLEESLAEGIATLQKGGR